MASVSAAPRLVARGLSARFGSVVALAGVDIHLDEAEAVAVIGPNGSGKSTLLNVLSGMQRGDAGRIVLDGVDVSAWSPGRLARGGMARTFQDGRLLEPLTALENVLLGLHSAAPDRHALRRWPPSRSRRRARALAALEAVGLLALWNARANTLSHGQRRRLELARVLVSGARVLLLDEPTAGLTPADVVLVGALIAEARDRGASVLVVEHDLDVVGRVAARVLVLDEGRIVATGTPHEVLGDAGVGRLLGIAAGPPEGIGVSA